MDNVKNEIFDYISKHGILTLCTSSGNKSWCSTAYYGLASNFDLYIVTDPSSRHGKYIKENSHVSFAIFDSTTKVTAEKQGIQAEGICTQVTDIVEIGKALMLWHKHNPGAESKINMEAVKKWIDTRIFKIKPTYIKMFSKEIFGEKEYGEITND